MSRFVSDGLSIHYRLVGADRVGVPRVFVNGSGSTIDDIEPLLGVLAGSCPAAVADHRGMGGSEIPPSQPAMADFASDVIALADHLSWASFDLIGVSFGGMVAQEVASRWPGRVRRLVLACTSSGGRGGSSYPLHELLDLSDEEHRRSYPTLQDVRFDESWLASRTGIAEGLAVAPRRSVPSAGHRMQMEARRHHDVWEQLPNVSAVTLVMAGRFDGIAPSDNGRRIADRIPTAEFREYEGGHLFFVQDAQAFVDIEDHLTRVTER